MGTRPPLRVASDLLEGEGGGLSAADLADRHALAVDGLDGDGDEGAQGVRAQQQGVVEADQTP